MTTPTALAHARAASSPDRLETAHDDPQHPHLTLPDPPQPPLARHGHAAPPPRGAARDPGVGVTRAFYDVARELTAAHGSLLLVDSIQAGLRTWGVLSIVDYPGFEDCVPPDLETYSKALNAGQYPLSVLAMTPKTRELLTPGLYGNTMTAAPRAMDVGSAVLESITPAMRENIRERGCEFVGLLNALAAEVDGAIVDVQGTGLLVACALDPERFLSHGENSIEEYLRTKGFGVIHGGKNALRYTPHFAVSTEELELIVEGIRDAILNGPRK